MRNKRGVLLVLTGPSGVGKGTVVRELRRREVPLFVSVSATTRPPRPGERDGTDYYFLTAERFEEMVGGGELLEHAEYVGNCYGTPAKPVLDRLGQGEDVLLEIEVQGAMQVRENCREAVLVFLVPPSFRALEERLRGRGTEPEEVVARRLEKARRECGMAACFDYVICNDNVETAADELLAVLTAEKCRAARRLPVLELSDGPERP